MSQCLQKKDLVLSVRQQTAVDVMRGFAESLYGHPVGNNFSDVCWRIADVYDPDHPLDWAEKVEEAARTLAKCSRNLMSFVEIWKKNAE